MTFTVLLSIFGVALTIIIVFSDNASTSLSRELDLILGLWMYMVFILAASYSCSTILFGTTNKAGWSSIGDQRKHFVISGSLFFPALIVVIPFGPVEQLLIYFNVTLLAPLILIIALLILVFHLWCLEEVLARFILITKGKVVVDRKRFPHGVLSFSIVVVIIALIHIIIWITGPVSSAFTLLTPFLVIIVFGTILPQVATALRQLRRTSCAKTLSSANEE